ncbi:MAG: EAL domain-containing protein, partial [Rhodospirillales bacterium]|nr:EAL domain-containing protein [Rhodospirillales bacterium]
VMIMAIVAAVVERAIRSVRESRDQFESLVTLSPDMICIVHEGVIRFINPAGSHMLGAPSTLPLVGTRLIDFVHPDYAAIFENSGEALASMADMKEPLPIILTSMKGRQVDGEMAVRRIGDKEETSFFIEIHNLSTKKQSAMEILKREQHITAIMDNAADGIVTMDESGSIETFNAAAARLFRRSASEVTGTNFCDLMDESCKEIQLGQHEVRAIRGDGLFFFADMTVSDVVLGDKHHFIATIRDVTNRKQSEDQIRHLANHDLVTNLPNRLAIQSYMNKAIENQKCGAVLFLSLRHHQRINDTLGHDLGEMLLRDIGSRLEETVGHAGVAGFWSAGEYVVTLPGATETKNTERLAAMLSDAISTPLSLRGHEINMSADIGVSLFPNDGDTPYRLIKAASMAMFASRNEGSWPCRHFTKEIQDRVEHRHYLESKLRHAIERNQLQAFYQPKIELKTGKVKGMEALARWIHPAMGMVSPVDFIPIAEETGLIVSIGEWMLETACRDTKAWHDAGFKDISVAVNLSGRQFESDNLIPFIQKTLSETGLDPRYLELEITESALMNDMAESLDMLTKLRDMGIRISIDDFGTGYSSLSYLKTLPVDTLKIDQSFVRHITEDADDAAIASTIVGMARNLSLGVVAEGIETADHEGFLKSLNCDVGQGYFYAKPMANYDFSEFLKNRATAAA